MSLICRDRYVAVYHDNSSTGTLITSTITQGVKDARLRPNRPNGRCVQLSEVIIRIENTFRMWPHS